MNKHRLLIFFLWTGLYGLLTGCANIVPPEGGKKDVTPPVLLSIQPSDSSLNIRPSLIELRFNKFMEVKDLNKNMQLSPLLSIPPTVISYLRRVEIKIADSLLQPNTTYRIDLGDALVDNREATPYKNFVYLFSTGSYFDSLELNGFIVDAATGKADTNALIMLYPDSETDSAIVKKKPLYAVKTDPSGHFSIQSLPEKSFRIYAIQDKNNNYLYDHGEEKIGFLNSMVIPTIHSDTLYRLNMFKAELDSTAADHTDSVAVASSGLKGKFSDRKTPPRVQSEIGYRVNVDTLNRNTRTFDLTQPLTIDLASPLTYTDAAKVYLSYEDEGIEVEAIQKLDIDSNKIKITTQWIGNKLYTLRLVKGWATDTTGKELPPGKYFFRTKSEDDYGTLKVHIPQTYFGEDYVLYIYFKSDSIYQKTITDSIIHLPLLQPGVYGMRIIADENKNGKWDAGNLFAQKQPEAVIPHNSDISLKAGWENEVDFQPMITHPQKKKEDADEGHQHYPNEDGKQEE